MVYPTYKVCKNVQVFETRQELLEYETAYSLFNQVYSATENGEWQVLHCVAILMSSKLVSQNDTRKTDSLYEATMDTQIALKYNITLG